MRRVLLVALVFVSSCATTRTNTERSTQPPSPATAATTPPATETPSRVPSASSSTIARYVAVSVATVWTDPSSPRSVDAPALANPARPREWIASMSDAQKLALVGRVQTQALYG